MPSKEHLAEDSKAKPKKFSRPMRKVTGPALLITLVALYGCSPARVLVPKGSEQGDLYEELAQVEDGQYKVRHFEFLSKEGSMTYAVGIVNVDEKPLLDFVFQHAHLHRENDLGVLNWGDLEKRLRDPKGVVINPVKGYAVGNLVKYHTSLNRWYVYPIKEKGDVLGYWLTVDSNARLNKSPWGRTVYFEISPHVSIIMGGSGPSGAGGGGGG